MSEKARAQKVLTKLSRAYSDAPPTYLEFNNPFEMLIATILSARAMDAVVNRVTRILFREYPDAKSMKNASTDRIAEIIHDVGTFNRKAEYLKKTASMIVESYNGEVPKNMEELVKFPGVSRKTANVVLQVAFGISEGVVVDTHIGRVTKRLEFSEEKSPEKIEEEIMKLLPRSKWADYARLLGAHGREICKSRRPDCPNCVVNNLCPSAEL